MTSERAQPNRGLMSFVNEAIRQLQESLSLGDAEFFCECGDSHCKERIRLTRGEYASCRAAGDALLVAAHGDMREGALRRFAGAPETGVPPAPPASVSSSVVGRRCRPSGERADA